MKRRTKPARRIWAVWYESNGGAYYLTFFSKKEATKHAKWHGMIRSEIVCYERREIENEAEKAE